MTELVLEREAKNLFPIPIGKMKEKKIKELPPQEAEQAKNEHKFFEKMRQQDDGESSKKSAKKTKLRKGRMQSAAPGELMGLMLGKNQ